MYLDWEKMQKKCNAQVILLEEKDDKNCLKLLRLYQQRLIHNGWKAEQYLIMCLMVISGFLQPVTTKQLMMFSKADANKEDIYGSEIG